MAKKKENIEQDFKHGGFASGESVVPQNNLITAEYSCIPKDLSDKLSKTPILGLINQEKIKVEFISTIFAGKGNEYRKGDTAELTPEQVEMFKTKIKVL